MAFLEEVPQSSHDVNLPCYLVKNSCITRYIA